MDKPPISLDIKRIVIYYVVHNLLRGYIMHLSYKTSRYKDKVYKSYFIAESYREGEKVKKRTIWNIGKLKDKQRDQIKLICKTVSVPGQVITTLENIVVPESKPYFDLAVVNALWEKWRLSRAFGSHVTNSELSTPLIAKILTINKCVAPCSCYSIPQWANNTALSEVVGHPLENLNDDKIYYELDKIAHSQIQLENHLFQMTYRKDKTSYDFVNYDLSSSYFVGMKCNLSNYGKSKDDKPKNKQVVLGILVNDKGYPFKWDVYPGNTAEVKTLTGNVDACRERFKLKDITMVFDRGIVSNDNLDYITDRNLKYISALDKNQIPGIAGMDLSVFAGISLSNFKARLSKRGYTCYDESLYFKDLGIIENQRYILGFNHVLFEDERKCRNEKFASFENFLIKKNKELRNATRSRDYDKTRQNIINELKRLKIKKYFHDPVLTEIKINKTNKRGKTTPVKSFQVTAEKTLATTTDRERLDGLCVFISNHIQSSGRQFIFSGKDIIKAYRDKTKIEDVFKHIKSFLKIRPFYVNLDEHVRAVYSICVLAYFLNKDIADSRKKIDGIDYLNSKNLYEPFCNGNCVTVKDKASGSKMKRTVELTSKQKYLLRELKIKVKSL
jgi:transposase